jgi:signal transduction histidine kinase
MQMRERAFSFGVSRGGPTSFQSRIAGMALMTAVSVLLAASVVFILQQWMSDQATQRRVQASSARFVAAEAGRLAQTDPRWAQDVLTPLAVTRSVVGAVVSGPGGERLASFGSDRRLPGDGNVMEGRAPIVGADGRRLGDLVLQSENPGLGAVVARYASASAALFFAAAGLALFVAKWLAARVTEPVRRLSRAMDQVAERGDFGQSVERMADDELGALTDTFNALLRKLEANDQALRRTLEELVVARDAAEAANVLKSHFLANMSHEIRTPLNGVLAMAQIMALGELSAVQRERLEVVHQSGEALLAVLNDVLDLSKIEAGKMELEPVEFELADLARDAEAAYGEVARRRGLELVVELRAPEGDRRRGDVGRLRQIASNLLSNAVKFTERGVVRLTLQIEPLAAGGGEALRLTVQDTGIGIPADKLPILFQKFTQVDSSTTRRFGGTGLGLAICRELAELMGGRMWVDSREGEGSTFHLLAPLPRASARPAYAAPAPAPLSLGGPRAPRVLAAEDNPANQLVLRTIMQTFGAQLTLVADGRAAVEAWRGGAFDLVLMDIQMPVMDGVAATLAIREAEAEAEAQGYGAPRTPIVALSANAMTHQVKAYLAAGMDMHLAKPLDIAKLLDLLRAVGAGAGPAEEAA